MPETTHVGRASFGTVQPALMSRRSLLVSLAAAGRLLAQKDTTFSTGVNVVNVFATVRNKQGQIIRNLTRDDFQVDEEGRPQTIGYFSQESNLPLTLGLLVDTSGSQRRVLGQERTASYKFLEQVLREDKDQAFVVHFDRKTLHYRNRMQVIVVTSLVSLSGVSPFDERDGFLDCGHGSQVLFFQGPLAGHSISPGFSARAASKTGITKSAIALPTSSRSARSFANCIRFRNAFH